MTAIVDYGVGNLFSLRCSLEAIGESVEVSSDPEVIRKADRVILPGVGAFADAAEKLRKSGLDQAVSETAAAAGKPLMGICLGMQMLFEKSLEYGEHAGLGLLKGTVRPIREILREKGADPEGRLKIPQMGWNALRIRRESPLLRYIREGDCVYFVHSYAADGCGDSLIADTEYGADLTACVGKGTDLRMPVPSGEERTVGLKILKAFVEMKA